MTKTYHAFLAAQTAYRIYILPSVQASPAQKRVAAAMLRAAIEKLTDMVGAEIDNIDIGETRLPS